MDDFAHAAFRERRARQTLRRRAFYLHSAIFVAVNLFLIVVWMISGSDTPWFLFVVFGWGIGLAAHAAATYWISRPSDVLLEQEEQRLGP